MQEMFPGRQICVQEVHWGDPSGCTLVGEGETRKGVGHRENTPGCLFLRQRTLGSPGAIMTLQSCAELGEGPV